MRRRYLQSAIVEDLAQKMVFLAGPRQVGKTTLAREVMREEGPGQYYLWDRREDRQALLKAEWPGEPATIILDELHKYRKWKQWIKGEYDKYKGRHRFLVTGSARLDIYRRGGDSLQGRYHHYRLHPFSLRELRDLPPVAPDPFREIAFPSSPKDRILDDLFQWSGFPEPILAGSTRTHRRWQKERLERFFREDVRDLENLRDFSSFQLLSDLLPLRVGSPLSLNSLREDLDVSHKALTHWMEILEKLYYAFRLRPYTTRRIRGLKKEAKCYLWDWSLIDDPGHRFENLVASHLLKFCHYLEDREGHRIELFYLRDVDRREVDFLVAVDHKPWFAVEAKVAEIQSAKELRYFGTRLNIPYLYQVVQKTDRDFVQDGVRVLSAEKFLGSLI